MKTTSYIIQRKNLYRFGESSAYLGTAGLDGFGSWSTRSSAAKFGSIGDLLRFTQRVKNEEFGAIIKLEETPGVSKESRRKLAETEIPKFGETVKYALYGALARMYSNGSEHGFTDLDGAKLYVAQSDVLKNFDGNDFGPAEIHRIAVSQTTSTPVVTETVLS